MATPPTIKNVQIDLYEDSGNVHMHIKQNPNVNVIPIGSIKITPADFGSVENEVKAKLSGFNATDFSKEDSKPTTSMFSEMFSNNPTTATSNNSMSNNILGYFGNFGSGLGKFGSGLGKFGSGLKNSGAYSINMPMNTLNRTVANLGKSINVGVDKVSFEDISKNVTEIYNHISNNDMGFDEYFKKAVEAYSKQLKEIKKTNITKFSATLDSWFNTPYIEHYTSSNLLNNDNWHGKEMYKIYNTIHVEYTLRKNLFETLEVLNKLIKDTADAAAADAKTAADKKQTGTKDTQTYFQTWITEFKKNYKNIPSIQLYTIYKNLKTLIDDRVNVNTPFFLIDETLYFNKPTIDAILFKNKVPSNAVIDIDKDDFVSQDQMNSILNYTKPFTFIKNTNPIANWLGYINATNNITEIYKDIITPAELIHPNNIEGNMTLNENDPIPGTATTKAFGNAVGNAFFLNTNAPTNQKYFGGRTKKYKKLHKRRIRKTYKR